MFFPPDDPDKNPTRTRLHNAIRWGLIATEARNLLSSALKDKQHAYGYLTFANQEAQYMGRLNDLLHWVLFGTGCCSFHVPPTEEAWHSAKQLHEQAEKAWNDMRDDKAGVSQHNNLQDVTRTYKALVQGIITTRRLDYAVRPDDLSTAHELVEFLLRLSYHLQTAALDFNQTQSKRSHYDISSR
jgi:hypothetical protein